MEGKLNVPEGTGEKMWHLLIKLLAEQYDVEIEYELERVTEDETA